MRLVTCLSIILIAACSTVPRTGVAPPTGAKIERSGYATVLRAPPAPYEPPPKILAGWEAPLPPGEVRLPTDDVEILQYRWERGISLNQARAEIMQLRAEGPEARAVEARAKAAEPENFVQLGIQRQPIATWTFAFKRDPEASLRRYTSNPRFVAKRLPYTAAEAEALWQSWWPRFEPYATGGGRGTEGVSFMMKVTEEEFRTLPQFLNFQPPSGIRLEFPKEPDLPQIAPDAAPFVRIFPQQRYFPGIIPTGGSDSGRDARLVLRDGCLFFGKALVRVNRSMGLFRDEQGYLALRVRGDATLPHVRIGEQITGAGGYSEPVSDVDRAWITSQCGDHPIVDLYDPKSKVNWERYIRSQFTNAPAKPKR